MTIKVKLIILILLAVSIYNCSDEPTSIGSPLVGSVNITALNSDSLNQSSSYYHPKVSLGSSERLLLGKSENVEASLLIKYDIILTDSLMNDLKEDSIVVKEAVMEFRPTYKFGDTLSSFDFGVHKVNSDWSTGFTEDSTVSYDAEDLTLDEPVVNDSLTSVTINNQIISRWLEIAADTSLLNDNKGVYLLPAEGTNKILGYQALTSSFTNYPIIRVVIEKPGVYLADTISFFSSVDVGVIRGNIPAVSNENILVRSGFVVYSKLFFDVSSIPKNATINSAELILTVDTLETKVGDIYSNSVRAFYSFDSTNTDSVSSFVITLSRTGENLRGYISEFVQEWIKGNNQGLILSPSGSLSGVELFAIKGSNAAVNVRPMLKIIYRSLQ